jgi:hypothetical protein
VKEITRTQLESRKAQAVRFVRDVLGDDDKADDIEDESLEDYAEHRQIKLTNPEGVTPMAAPARQELLDRIEELETTNEDLQSRLDEIADIIGDNDGGEDTDEDAGETTAKMRMPTKGKTSRPVLWGGLAETRKRYYRPRKALPGE